MLGFSKKIFHVSHIKEQTVHDFLSFLSMCERYVSLEQKLFSRTYTVCSSVFQIILSEG